MHILRKNFQINESKKFHIKSSHILICKANNLLDNRVYLVHVFKNWKLLFENCRAQVIYGPGPFTRGESEGPSREELWSKLDHIKRKTVLGYSRGQFSPRQTQNPTGKKGQSWYKTKLERKVKNIRGKLLSLPFNALYLTEPYSSTVTTTLSMGWWDKYLPKKVKPTRGRWRMATCRYKRKSK